MQGPNDITISRMKDQDAHGDVPFMGLEGVLGTPEMSVAQSGTSQSGFVVWRVDRHRPLLQLRRKLEAKPDLVLPSRREHRYGPEGGRPVG
jgi:hypothetical protein